MLTFQDELLKDIINEIVPLLKLHWEENANFKKDIKLDPNYDAYNRLACNDALSILTARFNNNLCGYYISNVLPHPHYKSSLYSFIDIYFLLPEHRNFINGFRLFEEYEKSMQRRAKLEGRDQIVLVGRARLENQGAQKILDKLGWEAVEMCYTKLLKVE